VAVQDPVLPHGRIATRRSNWAANAAVGSVSVLAAGGAAARRRRQSWRATARNADAAAQEGAGAATPPDSKRARDPYAEEKRARDPYAEEKSKSVAPSNAGGDGGIGAMIEKYKWSNLSEETQEDLKTFFVSLTVALSVRFFLVEPRFIPSLSMYPTFDVGDQLTVDKISKNWRDLKRRDVVVFYPPPAFQQYTGVDRTGEALIKRIVALEGDVVEVKNGGNLYINGEKQDEPYTNEKAKYEFGPTRVPKGCVLVLGDNRNQSLDGHIWGWLPTENIIGRATLKFWPPWHVGTVEGSPP